MGCLNTKTSSFRHKSLGPVAVLRSIDSEHRANQYSLAYYENRDSIVISPGDFHTIDQMWAQ